ncbi:MAG: peroxiredoxin [Sphingomonadales bacterium]|nr:peroxiredoxin [Sphingomonadales bacterium]
MTRNPIALAALAVPAAVIAAAALLSSQPAHAALAVGAKAPDFTTRGAEDGKPFDFSLKAALKKGPVVLYFYPKAFTKGCTLEAHAFSEAIDDFRKAGATVVGMSADDLPTLQKFSTEECRSKFPVAIAGKDVIKAYDVALTMAGVSVGGLTSRTSYVIGRDGKVKLAYTNMDWRDHVKLTLAAVQAK